MNNPISKLLFLRPLALLYGFAVCLRNKLFDWGIFSEEKFNIPIISIGNITVGGTGKTPHTEYIINLLLKKYRLAVLSRGYKRKTRGFCVANENSTSSQIGDEPLQIFRKFPSILIAVDANRRRGVRKLLNLPENLKPEVILLDDAFQHRYVKPSLSILLTDVNQPFYNDQLLPAGRLREHPKNYKRADWIICTKCRETLTESDYKTLVEKINLQPHQQLFFSSYQYKKLLPVFPELNAVKEETIEQLNINNYKILLVTGLANPEGLIEYVKKYSTDLQTIVYPDHHNYTRNDIQSMMNFINSTSGKNKIIVTSEKDAMRLINNPFIPDEIKALFYYLPIEVIIRINENLFTQNIENHVRTFKRNGIMA